MLEHEIEEVVVLLGLNRVLAYLESGDQLDDEGVLQLSEQLLLAHDALLLAELQRLLLAHALDCHEFVRELVLPQKHSPESPLPDFLEELELVKRALLRDNGRD